MKAVRIHHYGGPEVVLYEDAPVPEIGVDEVLIKVRAAAVNPADWRTRNGQFQAMRPLAFPAILGLDVSGTVEAIGSRISRVAPHDAVIARALKQRGVEAGQRRRKGLGSCNMFR